MGILPVKISVSRFPLLIFLLGLLPCAGTALGQEDLVNESRLEFTNWSASVYSHKAGGRVCWLAGPDGSLRVELMQGALGFVGVAGDNGTVFPDDLAPLLTRSGEGWTLVLGPDDTGTLNAWGREWREPPAGLSQLVRVVTESLKAHPGPAPDLDFAPRFPLKQPTGTISRPGMVLREKSGGTEEPWRYQLEPLDPEMSTDSPGQGFRGRMTARGRGAGGEREVLSLTWVRQPNGPGYGVSLRSSRRPGTLELEFPRSVAVKTPVPEVFLPLWSLDQFF